MNIGDVIASARRRKKMDQKEMARRINVSPSYLSQIESKGRKPSAKLLAQIAVVLEVPVSALLYETLEETNFLNNDDRQLFLKAKPMLDKMISILLSGDTQNNKHESLTSNAS
jgi:transcriptional regulator with XRE-family HTH domain